MRFPHQWHSTRSSHIFSAPTLLLLHHSCVFCFYNFLFNRYLLPESKRRWWYIKWGPPVLKKTTTTTNVDIFQVSYIICVAIFFLLSALLLLILRSENALNERTIGSFYWRLNIFFLCLLSAFLILILFFFLTSTSVQISMLRTELFLAHINNI